MKLLNILLIVYINKITSYSCRSQKSKTCVTLDFTINGSNEITNCDLLQSTFNDFVIEHNFFCNNMNQSYVDLLCVSTNTLQTNCYVDIGLSINTLYEKNNQICSLNATIFDHSVNSIYTNITNYCNSNLNQDGDLSGIIITGIIFGIFLGFTCLICLCINMCKPIEYVKTRPNLWLREVNV